MLCGKCHRNRATVRYAEVIDGKVVDLHLCADCLNQMEAGGKGFALSGPAPVPDLQMRTRRRREVKGTCQACGTELRAVLETEKVGCSRCYQAFATELESLLEGLHTGLHHRGKRPHVDDSRAQLHGNLEAKRALLKSALKLENYEEAAGLRDEIKKLEQALETGAAPK